MKPWASMVHRRYLLLLIVLSLCVAASVQAAESHQVRVLTYNIHHGEGLDGKIDLARIAAVIQRSSADIVALQEVDKATGRSKGVDQAAELGSLTKMHVAFGKAMDFDGGQYGQAILSRYPLSEIKTHPLPFTPGCEPRCALAVHLQLSDAGPEVVFANTHLEHAKPAVRLCQANKLNPQLVAKNSRPTILAGDFNDVPESLPIRVLEPFWQDATTAFPEPTWPSDQPRQKIDYVFFRPASAWQVIERQVVDESVASDHRPLLVVLKWKATNDPLRN